MRLTKRSMVIALSFFIAIVLLFTLTYFLDPGATSKIDPKKIVEGEDDNNIEIVFYDPDQGGKPVRFKAKLKKHGVNLNLIREQPLKCPFGEGKATIPLNFGDSSLTGGGSGFIDLTFEEAIYENFPGITRKALIHFPANGECRFREGDQQNSANSLNVIFKTLKVDWEEPGYATMVSDKQVTITRQSPFLLLKGEGGLQGDFKKAEKSSQLYFPAPVSVFLTKEMGAELPKKLKPAGEKLDTEIGAYLGIQCDGALAFDLKRNTFTFDKNVILYNPKTTTQKASKDDPYRFECHQLIMTLNRGDTETPVRQVEARRGVNMPVRCYWDTVTIESGKATWEGRTERSTLSDAPHLWGTDDMFVFDATATQIDMDPVSGVAKLSGPIQSLLRQNQKIDDKALPTVWDLKADFGEVFCDPDDHYKISKIIVTTDPMLEGADGVQLESRDNKKIRAIGGKLVYDVATQKVKVTGLPNHWPKLHLPHDRESVDAHAKVITFAFEENKVYLEEGVSVNMIQKRDNEDPYMHRLMAHKVCITLKEGIDAKDMKGDAGGKAAGGKAGDDVASTSLLLKNDMIQRIEAWALNQAQPLEFSLDGPSAARLAGGKLVWEQGMGKITILPYKEITRQTISFRQGTLFAKTFEFFPIEQRIVAEGQVAVEGIKVRDDVFAVHADKVECFYKDNTGDETIAPPTLSAIRKVVASSLPLKKVTLSGETISGSAKIIEFDSEKDYLLFTGGEKQVFKYFGRAGRDEVSAREITYIPSEKRLKLVNDVSGVLHQANWAQDQDEDEPEENVSEEKASDSKSALPDMANTRWQYNAREAEILFKEVDKQLIIVSCVVREDYQLVNPDVNLVITGKGMRYYPETETIDLGNVDERTTLQNIRYGPKGKESWLTARQIKLSRRERLDRGGKKPEIVAVLSKDVRCNFHLRTLKPDKPISQGTPKKIDITADRIIFVVPAENKVIDNYVSYAKAEGQVVFKAYHQEDYQGKPPYSGSGAKAVYQHAPMTFTIFGDGKGRKATITYPLGEEKSDAITIIRHPDGSFKLNPVNKIDGSMDSPFPWPNGDQQVSSR